MSRDLLCIPLPPGYRALRLHLVLCALTGNAAWIVYEHGTQPRSRREIGPVAWVGTHAVRAWCLASGRIKTYELNVIRLVDQDSPDPVYEPPLEAEEYARAQRGCQS